MEKRLVGKGGSEAVVKRTVEWLEEIGAINDEEYALMIAKHYSAKGYGLARVRDELFKRGIPRDMWDSAVSGIGTEGLEESALGFLDKKLKGSRDKDDLRRAADALCRRGFSYEEARAAVGRYIENLDESMK
jgi:regulatory protein